ncbi:hypothetical protein J3E69DRAFT_339380 [Trichoderma sp. SZMC 28015]
MLQAEYEKRSLTDTEYHGYVRRSFIFSLAALSYVNLHLMAPLTFNLATDSITRQGRGFPLKNRKKNYCLLIWTASACVGVGTLDIHSSDGVGI